MERDDTKICAACGRLIEWRKKWADDWQDVKYCSAACRKEKPNALDRRMEQEILDALAAVPAHRANRIELDGLESRFEDDGRGDLRERLRRAARRLAADGRVELLQNGRQVDPSTARGPLEISRRR